MNYQCFIIAFQGATAILEMVEFYQSACKINLAYNPKMGMRGWQTLCRMLRKTPCVYYLDARRTMLTDQTMPMFGRCLKADPFLKILHLEGIFLSGRPLLILSKCCLFWYPTHVYFEGCTRQALTRLELQGLFPKLLPVSSGK